MWGPNLLRGMIRCKNTIIFLNLQEKEEKIKESLSFLDEMNQKSKEEKNKQWTTTIEIAKMIRVKTIDRPLSLWGRIKQRLYTSWEYPRLILRSQDPLWSILDSDCCKLLSVMNSSETYKPHPQQELRIITAHQELSKQECNGLTAVYHKEQLIAQVQWHLTLSDGKATLVINLPSVIGSRLIPSLHQWNTLIKIS